jgi:hypothetical protein
VKSFSGIFHSRKQGGVKNKKNSLKIFSKKFGGIKTFLPLRPFDKKAVHKKECGGEKEKKIV